MKNTLLLLSSLNGNAFNSLMKRLPSMLDNRFLLFCGLEASANAAGCGENLLKLKNQLKLFAIESVELTEYGLDEFLFNHSAKGFEEKPIYLTPVVFSSIITASIELLKYNGPLYLYDMNPAKDATRMEPFKNAFHCRHNAGDRALDKSSAAYSHVVGSICHFSVDGITYQQVLKGRAAVKDTGIEGYTMICEEAPQYRIKIWDNVTKTKSDLEKVEKMIRLAPSCKDVALPLAFVYNDHDQPIGIVMKDFKGGNQIDLKVWRTLDEPLLYIKQLLEELLRLETNYCLHRDFDHNFLVNQEEKRLCIIDTESIQLGNYRATSFSNLDLNALPKQYEKYSGNAFFNTVEISYSSLTMLLAAYVEVTSLIREWNDAGFVELNNNELNKLKEKSVSLAILAEDAYTKGKPASLEKQLAVVNALLKGEELLSEPKTVVVEPVQRFNPERPHSVPVTDGDADDDLYGDMPMRKEKRNPSISKNEGEHPPIDKKSQENGQMEKEAPLRESSSLSSGTKKKPAAFTVDPIVDPDAPAKHAKRRPQRKTNRLYEKLRAIGLRTFLIHLLVKWFANGTVVEGMTEEEILRHSVKSVPFRRKVLGTVLTAVMIIAMLVCIKYM